MLIFIFSQLNNSEPGPEDIYNVITDPTADLKNKEKEVLYSPIQGQQQQQQQEALYESSYAVSPGYSKITGNSIKPQMLNSSTEVKSFNGGESMYESSYAVSPVNSKHNNNKFSPVSMLTTSFGSCKDNRNPQLEESYDDFVNIKKRNTISTSDAHEYAPIKAISENINPGSLLMKSPASLAPSPPSAFPFDQQQQQQQQNSGHASENLSMSDYIDPADQIVYNPHSMVNHKNEGNRPANQSPSLSDYHEPADKIVPSPISSPTRQTSCKLPVAQIAATNAVVEYGIVCRTKSTSSVEMKRGKNFNNLLPGSTTTNNDKIIFNNNHAEYDSPIQEDRDEEFIASLYATVKK